ncbi:MAG: type 4a pilus biogenesis protein PilO [Candidatus Muiribacteriota bacterium]
MSIRMKSILERFASYILILIFVFLNLYFVLSVQNQSEKINLKETEIAQIESEIQNFEEEMENLQIKLNERRVKQSELNNKTDLFKDYFITRKDIPAIMSSIQEIGDKSNVDIKLFEYTPMREVNLTGFIKLDFEIFFKGDYRNIKTFLFNLENLPWILKQKDISFVTLFNSSSYKQEMELSIKLFTYIRETNVKAVRNN